MVWWRTIYHLQSVQHEWWYSRREKKTVWHQQKKFEKLIQLAMYTWVFVCVYVCTTIPQRHTGWRNEFSMQPVHFTEPGWCWQFSEMSKYQINVHIVWFLQRNFDFLTKILLKGNENYGLIISQCRSENLVQCFCMVLFEWQAFTQKNFNRIDIQRLCVAKTNLYVGTKNEFIEKNKLCHSAQC